MVKDNHIILMGDIAKSREKDANTLRVDFRDLIDSCNRELKDKILSPYTITLGDEFQGVAQSASGAIDAIFFLEEASLLHALDFNIRYVTVEGEIDTPLNKTIAYGMMGKGIVSAREKLSDKGRGKPRFQCSFKDSRKSQELNKLFLVLDGITSTWKPKDGALIVSMINNGNNEAVGDKFKKTRSQIWKRRKALQVQEYTILKSLIMQKFQI